MKKLVILSAGLALAACNSGNEGTFQTEDGGEGSYSVDGSGDQATLTVKTDEGEFNMQSGSGAADVKLPAGFAVYPGSNVTSRSTMKSERGSNLTLAMETGDAADKVVDYYRRQATGAGVDIQSEIKTGQMQMISGKDKGGMVFSLSVFPGAEGKTTATLSLVEETAS